MIWGEQWVCPCGTHNLFLRKRCRDCGADKSVGAVIETVTEILQNFKEGKMPKREMTPTEALRLILDQVDYTAGAGSAAEPVGGLLSVEVINTCRAALASQINEKNRMTLANLRQRHDNFTQGRIGSQSTASYADMLIRDLFELIKGHAEEMRTLEAALSNRGTASQPARQIMRDLVTAAAAVLEASSGDLSASDLTAIERPLGALEDLAVEAMVAAGRTRAAEAGFDAGAAFDLFWPEGLPPPAMPLHEAPNDAAFDAERLAHNGLSE